MRLHQNNVFNATPELLYNTRLTELFNLADVIVLSVIIVLPT